MAEKPKARGQQGRGKKQKDFFITLDDKFIYDKDSDNIMDKIIITDPQKKAKGGRVNLRGGGICKKGMNKKAIGANS
jgi:hypothetical protein|tara:strand:+ start:213 stop:443 length:231 start_codon:yes stop_codon:yes gene_type:complete